MNNFTPILEQIRQSERLQVPNHLQYGIGNPSIPIEGDLEYLLDKLNTYNETGDKKDLLTFTRQLLESFNELINAHLQYLYNEKYKDE